VCHQQFSTVFCLSEDGSIYLVYKILPKHSFLNQLNAVHILLFCGVLKLWQKRSEDYEIIGRKVYLFLTSSAVEPFCMHEEDANKFVAETRRVGKQSYINDADSPGAIKNCYRLRFIQYERKLLILKSVARRSQWPRGLRPLVCCDRRFESHRGHGCCCVVCCHVEVSATS
jgi:hypothetical protein